MECRSYSQDTGPTPSVDPLVSGRTMVPGVAVKTNAADTRIEGSHSTSNAFCFAITLPEKNESVHLCAKRITAK